MEIDDSIHAVSAMMRRNETMRRGVHQNETTKVVKGRRSVRVDTTSGHRRRVKARCWRRRVSALAECPLDHRPQHGLRLGREMAREARVSLLVVDLCQRADRDFPQCHVVAGERRLEGG